MGEKRVANTGFYNPRSGTLSREAQGLMEYALIIVLVAIIVLVVLAILGPGVGNLFSNVVNNI